MKLAVSHDAQGNITTLFNPETLHNDKGFLTYVPAKGEKHYVLDLPKEFEGKPFEELPNLLRVNASGAHPQFERKG